MTAKGAEFGERRPFRRHARMIENLTYDGNEPFDRVVYPFSPADGLGAQWLVLVDVPRSAIQCAGARQNYMNRRRSDASSARVPPASISPFAASIQKPALPASWATSRRSGNGEYTRRFRSGTLRRKAPSQVAQGFRHQLADNRRLESEARHRESRPNSNADVRKNERSEASALQRDIVARLGKALCISPPATSPSALPATSPANTPSSNAISTRRWRARRDDPHRQPLGRQYRSGTSEISGAANDLSHRTEQQAASLEETAAALDETASQVNASAENAKVAAKSVEVASSDAEQSGEVVQKAIAAMNGIGSRRWKSAGSSASSMKSPSRPTFGAQCRGRGRPRRRRRQGLRGRRTRRSANSRSALQCRKGNQDADQYIGGPGSRGRRPRGQGRRRSRRSPSRWCRSTVHPPDLKLRLGTGGAASRRSIPPSIRWTR